MGASRLLWLVAACLACSPTLASAQIYSWRDATGSLVLSNRQPDQQQTGIQTYAVPTATATRTTRAVTGDRTKFFDDLLVEHARKQNVRPDLVRAVVQVESGFNPFAQSPKGAVGLMQLMPATIAQFGVKRPFDPGENVAAGVAYLKQLLDRYDGNEQLALAAYNAGPGAVDRHGQTVPPYAETRNYVSMVGKAAGQAPPSKGAPPAVRKIYKTTELVDGHPVPHYSDQKPASGPYEVISVK